MEENRPSVGGADRGVPKDIAGVSIDPAAPCADRIRQYVKQIGDPYCYMDSGIVVRLAYSDTDVSLQDRLRDYGCSLF